MPLVELFLVVAMALGCFGAWLFGSAALHKVTDFPRFSATLAAYRLAPQVLTGTLAAMVVVLELMAALGLLFVFLAPIVAPAVGAYVGGQPGILALGLLAMSVLAPTLILSYAAAMSVNLLRGRRSIDCGCGGTPMPLSKALVVRNVALGAGLIWALLVVLNRSPSLSPAGLNDTLGGGTLLLLVASSSLVLGFVYLIINQLLANRALHEQLWIQHR